ncbi:DciA family protein [Bibersteinia trehalosi]|uniref:DciA family protein n=1 Tax=Bibersteinia trehalosi TaxID=47735 RepID=UPI002D79B13E|nr:DciA family protein [Bibersteinia trehalosi]
MKNSTTKNISEILQNSALHRIVQRATELNSLNDKIQQSLPSIYRGLYRIRNLADNQLVLDVPNATIRQGLLLQQGLLLKLIQQDLPQVHALNIRVDPNFKLTESIHFTQRGDF